MKPQISPQKDEIPRVRDGVVVWHRRQLRTADHPALTYAADNYDAVLPVFVFDPVFYGEDGLACDARIRFLHDCLRDLEEQYGQTGGTLTYAHGDPIDVLRRFGERGWEVVATADPAGRYGLKRDNAAAEACGVTFIDSDGLVRSSESTRDGWSDHVEEWFESDLHGWEPEDLSLAGVETSIGPDRIAEAYDVTPEKTEVPEGGRGPAIRRIEEFTGNISEYPGSISAPTDAKTGTSRLSAYLRFGCLSVREAYRYVTENAADDRAAEMFVSRL